MQPLETYFFLFLLLTLNLSLLLNSLSSVSDFGFADFHFSLPGTALARGVFFLSSVLVLFGMSGLISVNAG